MVPEGATVHRLAGKPDGAAGCGQEWTVKDRLWSMLPGFGGVGAGASFDVAADDVEAVLGRGGAQAHGVAGVDVGAGGWSRWRSRAVTSLTIV
jgi:hypothetical protein